MSNKKPRKRLTNKERRQELKLVLQLFKYGCTRQSIEDILEISKIKIGQYFADAAFLERGLPNPSDKRVIVKAIDLPLDIQNHLALSKSDFIEIEKLNDSNDGIYKVVSTEELLQNLKGDRNE